MNPQYQRGLILFQQGRHADAAHELRQSLANDPHDANAHALLGLCLVQLEDLQQATYEAGVAVGIAPWLGFTHYVMAQVLSKRNKIDEAIAAVTEAIRLEPQNPSYFSLLASLRFDQRQWPAALQAAELGLQQDPNHSGCTNLRAMALVNLGRRAEAGATIGAALARDPENAFTHANQGWALLHQGQHRPALEHFREALRLDPQLEWARLGIVEALKSHFFIYRWMLRYFLWMSRLAGRAQWGIVVGAYVGYEVLRSVAAKNPAMGKYIWPVLVAYMVFVALTWLAGPFFNLLLRLSRFGRLTLSRHQITTSNWIGSLLLAALVSGGLWLVTRNPLIGILGIVLASLLFPMAGMFRCPAGWPRVVMICACGGLALLGLGVVVLGFSLPSLAPPARDMVADQLPVMFKWFIYGTLGAQIASNYLAGVRVTR